MSSASLWVYIIIYFGQGRQVSAAIFGRNLPTLTESEKNIAVETVVSTYIWM